MYKLFEEKINYKFKNVDLLKLAFTHSSYAHENKMETFLNNERLEFLGDAVLELAVSNFLYRRHEKMSEGDLTKLRASIVCEPTLASNSRELGVGDYILLGKGEEQTGGRDRDSILADTFESVIGAIYLDGGFVFAEKFILKMLLDDIDILKDNYMNFDYKTNLQEYYQRFSKTPLKYIIVKEEGPDHDKLFTAQLRHGTEVLGIGKGKSKKEAEQNAAYETIKKNNISLAE